jgi:hypothetical protein
MGLGTPHFPEVTVALQGTLDTFALADVLRLLASTKKSGRLRVTGDRGSGSVWVQNGEVVATELAVPGASDDGPAHTLFTLLRFAAGSFTFEAGAVAPHAGTPLDVEPLLGQAEMLLVEWRAIEAVVPSLEAWLTLRPELDGDVVVDAGRWRAIAAIGGGATAGSVGEALGAGELDVLRAVKELVELGLVEVGERPAGPVTAVVPRGHDGVGAGHGIVREPAPPSLSEIQTGLGSVTLSDENGSERVEPLAVAPPPIEPPAAPPAPPAPPVADVPSYASSAGSGEPDLDDAAEIARQLANLSPRAAKAVAAAAKATTDEEREAALAAIEAEDETVNRGLLMRFLGSVES